MEQSEKENQMFKTSQNANRFFQVLDQYSCLAKVKMFYGHTQPGARTSQVWNCQNCGSSVRIITVCDTDHWTSLTSTCHTPTGAQPVVEGNARTRCVNGPQQLSLNQINLFDCYTIQGRQKMVRGVRRTQCIQFHPALLLRLLELFFPDTVEEFP